MNAKKSPWHLRWPGALNLKEIAATDGIGTIYGLLFAILLFAPLMPHIAAQSSGTPTTTSSTAQLQDGAQPQWVWVILPVVGIGVRITFQQWLRNRARAIAGGVAISAVGGIAGMAVWNELTKKWEIPPGATRKGRVTARARIGIWKVDSERTHWYGRGPESGLGIRNGGSIGTILMTRSTLIQMLGPSALPTKNAITSNFDYWTDWLYWDADNEIWKSNGGSQHHYGTGTYLPDCINDAYNQTKENTADTTQATSITERAKRGILLSRRQRKRRRFSGRSQKSQKRQIQPLCSRHSQRHDLHGRRMEIRTTHPIRQTLSHKRAERCGK